MSKTSKIIILLPETTDQFPYTCFLFIFQNNKGDSGVDILRGAFPFGENTGTTTDPSTRTGGEDGGGFLFNENNRATSKLFMLHKKAVAGVQSFTAQDSAVAGDIIVRYIERGLGHIFETNMSTLQEARISNTTRLKIYEAMWGDKGKDVIIRYLADDDNKTIRTFLVNLSDFTPSKEETPSETPVDVSEKPETGVFLPENIKAVIKSNNNKNIFYLVNTGNVALGVTYNIKTGKTSQLFRSPFTEWLPQWPNKNTITLTTKPSGGVAGFLYFLDIKTEEVTKTLGDIAGLTTLTSPDGEEVIYSESTGDSFVLNLYNTKNLSKQKLPFATLPEKCAWSNTENNILYCAIPTTIVSGVYPDIWYQGLVSFSDEIWKINTETLSTELLVTPENEVGIEIDAANLSLGPNESYLFFINKKDLSLWGVRI